MGRQHNYWMNSVHHCIKIFILKKKPNINNGSDLQQPLLETVSSSYKYFFILYILF